MIEDWKRSGFMEEVGSGESSCDEAAVASMRGAAGCADEVMASEVFSQIEMVVDA
jgi:flavin-binding protein dodecin